MDGPVRNPDTRDPTVKCFRPNGRGETRRLFGNSPSFNGREGYEPLFSVTGTYASTLTFEENF